MGKNNLDSILLKNKKVLPQEVKEKAVPKPKKERDSEVVSIKIKPSELAAIKEKAGELVPLGTYMKHYLRTKTDLFDESGESE